MHYIGVDISGPMKVDLGWYQPPNRPKSHGLRDPASWSRDAIDVHVVPAHEAFDGPSQCGVVRHSKYVLARPFLVAHMCASR